MTINSKDSEISIMAIKKVRNLMHHHLRQAIFCKEHNMTLDELKHREIEEVLRKLAMSLEDIFGTGYVKVKFEDD